VLDYKKQWHPTDIAAGMQMTDLQNKGAISETVLPTWWNKQAGIALFFWLHETKMKLGYTGQIDQKVLSMQN